MQPRKPFSSLSDSELIEKLSENDVTAFNYLVETNYTTLCRTALKYTRSEEQSEEIVQDVFVSIWNNRHELTITSSLLAYLHTAVKYRSLNHLKSEFRKPAFESNFPESVPSLSASIEQEISAQDLEKLIAAAINALPNKCKVIFNLSRNGGLTYKEIAAQLEISQKTVETQMSIALSRIKDFLGKNWDNLIVLAILLRWVQFF